MGRKMTMIMVGNTIVLKRQFFQLHIDRELKNSSKTEFLFNYIRVLYLIII
jgi:hypothetical protein